VDSPTPHPHFDDRGALDWEASWVMASDRARRERKRIFVELGNELCGSCRSLVEAVLPRPDVAPLLREHYVALASDSNDPEDEVLELARSMGDATQLPFVMIADADGRFLEGSSGAVDPARLRELLQRCARGAPGLD